MDLLEKVLFGWKLLFGKLITISDPGTLIFVLPLTAAVLLFSYVALSKARYIRKKLQLRINKDKKSYIKLIVRKISTNKWTRGILKKITLSVSMFTPFSYEKNQDIAAALLIAFLLIAVLSIFIVFPGSNVVWYLYMAYIGLAVFFMVLIFYVFEMLARIRFTSKLPETFKLLNSRYTSKGNILKAIAASMDDFDRAVKKEMRAVYDVLRKNNMHEIDNTFQTIENAYRNEYLTLLLNLIRQAHYKGGEVTIKEQFEQATEDVLLDIENQKDLSITGRAYILLAIVMPVCLKGVEVFNHSALGAKSVEFYSSPYGIQLKLLFLFALIGFIAYLMYLERTA